MSIKRPTSGGQTRDEEAAVQQTFHLERSSFFYLSLLMVRTRCSTTTIDNIPSQGIWEGILSMLLPCILHAAALNPDTEFCPPEVKPRPLKTITSIVVAGAEVPNLEFKVAQNPVFSRSTHFRAFLCFMLAGKDKQRLLLR